MKIKPINNEPYKEDKEKRELIDNQFLELNIDGMTLEDVIKESAYFGHGDADIADGKIPDMYIDYFNDPEVTFEMNLATGYFYSVFEDLDGNECVKVKNIYSDRHLISCSDKYYRFIKAFYMLYHRYFKPTYPNQKNLLDFEDNKHTLQKDFEKLELELSLEIVRTPIVKPFSKRYFSSLRKKDSDEKINYIKSYVDNELVFVDIRDIDRRYRNNNEIKLFLDNEIMQRRNFLTLYGQKIGKVSRSRELIKTKPIQYV